MIVLAALLLQRIGGRSFGCLLSWLAMFLLLFLMGTKIVWDPDFDEDDTEVFIMTLDGTDFRIWEPKHQSFPYDKGYYAHKFKKAGLRYEI